MSIEGDWNVTKEYCSCGYTSTWTVTLLEGGEKVVVEEKCGSYCCGCVPNCCPKLGCWAHRMDKVEEEAGGETTTWAGSLCCKPIKLGKESDSELNFLTTEGPMIMTRN
mmetsp:Transcript_25669/g.39326  ORF Transcript_25669/g.39326 Transcript_25669/m.39326 type:complete len:109 (+) Transcript_25669:227-553(+)